jgi:hypothetical protein
VAWRRLSKAKPIVRALVTILFLAAAAVLGVAAGVEHRHDAFAKTVQPFLNVFATDRKTEDRAFSLSVTLESATDLPKEMLGLKAEIAVEVPDKLRLQGPLLGETFTIVRNGQKVWISPGTKARALLEAAKGSKTLPPGDKEARLTDFALPFSEKSMVFLPALFSVKDLGFDAVDGVECRALDVTLMPELEEKLKVRGWVGRLWVTPDHKPARVTIARKGWHVVARVTDVKFAATFPESTWRPTVEENSDLLELSASEYGRFLSGFWGVGR